MAAFLLLKDVTELISGFREVNWPVRFAGSCCDCVVMGKACGTYWVLVWGRGQARGSGLSMSIFTRVDLLRQALWCPFWTGEDAETQGG